jgi:LysM repeat protein
MSSRTPTRWLAPIALLVALAAVGYVVRDFSSSASEEEPAATQTTTSERESQGGGSDEEEEPATTTEGDGETTTSTTPRNGKKSVRVGPGDTLGSIAEENDLTVEEVLELNPDLDPNSLNVGDRVKLAP